MFFTLLLTTLAISLLVSFLTARTFSSSITKLLQRIIKDDIASAWTKYILFSTYVIGISGGVRLKELERYINPGSGQRMPLVLDMERWTVEIYRTVLETLQSLSGLYFFVFAIALIAYAIVRSSESRALRTPTGKTYAKPGPLHIRSEQEKGKNIEVSETSPE